VFTAPTRLEMQATVLRALRDPNATVFPPETINDFINLALADLSGYRPKELRESADWPLDTDTPPFTSFIAVWRVSVNIHTDSIGNQQTVILPYADSSNITNRVGWDFYENELTIPGWWVLRINAMAQNYWTQMRVWGYTDRTQPVDDDSILDLLDATDYLCVTNHCKAQGFELLNHDRALYQQWLAQTNNTDVSPTQLQGMYSQAEATFQRSRARNTKMRRMPSAEYVHTY
jgi:hypothetical protein